MKNSVKLVFKGILLYMTLTICTLSIMIADSLLKEGYLVLDFFICTVMVTACFACINRQELNKLAMIDEKKEDEEDYW